MFLFFKHRIARKKYEKENRIVNIHITLNETSAEDCGKAIIIDQVKITYYC